MCLHIIYMLTNRCMTYSISNGCARPVLDPLEYNKKSISYSYYEENNDHVMGE